MSKQTKTTGRNHDQPPAALPTFMDHLQELKSRLFFVAVGFVVSAGIAYPFFQDVINLLVRPLGEHELYYLSPAGGLSFIIKVCMYMGIIGALPVIIYQLYRFTAPVMPVHKTRTVVGYTLTSALLAVVGVGFAYFVSLPAALHFLTNIDLKNITAMLTIDAYMSFIMAYLLAGALLFQLPLVMLIINSVNPLPPRKLMGFQRHMIVLSFIAAAIVSPTPDVVNQTLLAAPIVVMYQIGILLVWLRQRSKKRSTTNAGQPASLSAHHGINQTVQNPQAALMPPSKAPGLYQIQPLQLTMDIAGPSRTSLGANSAPLNHASQQAMHSSRQQPIPSAQGHSVNPSMSTPARVVQRRSVQVVRRNIDGVVRAPVRKQQVVGAQFTAPKSQQSTPSIDGFLRPVSA